MVKYVILYHVRDDVTTYIKAYKNHYCMISDLSNRKSINFRTEYPEHLLVLENGILISNSDALLVFYQTSSLKEYTKFNEHYEMIRKL